MPVVKDPRSYIKRVPVPVPSHVGMKIQTRSITHYRATTPVTDKRPTPSLLVTPKDSISYEDTQSQGTETSVDDADMTQGMVNYYRRLDQQLTQGYNAPKNRPYQGIGDPFYLDEEELILHSLGQWHPSHQIEQDNSDDDDMIETISSVKQLQKNMGSSAKMMLSKPRKDLNTLSKEIAHGRNMIRNVKLGHGLFDLIKHERDAKKIAEEEQDKKKMLAMRNQWQPPKEQTSSDEESEEDLEQDVDLTGYMQSNGKETDEEIEEGKIFITEENVDDDASVKDRDQEIETVTAMSSRPITGQFPARKKKKQKQPRPYTPLHNSIVEKREFGKSMNQREATEVRESPKDHPAAQALFRQLCALHWLLKAMNEESTTNITPIRSCWKYKELGGTKVSNDQLSDEKDVSRRWREFSSTKSSPAYKERLSNCFQHAMFIHRFTLSQQNKRINRFTTRGTSKKWNTQRNSTMLSAGSQLGLLGVPRQSLAMDQSVSDDTPASTSRQDIDEDDQEQHQQYKSIFKFLNTEDDDRLKSTDPSSDKQDTNMSSYHEKRKKDKRFTDDTKTPRKSPRKSVDASKNAEIEARLNYNFDKYDEEEKRNSKIYRADFHIRPKSSPALIQFQLNRVSIKKGNLPNEMNNKFRELQDDGALTLHDRFEQKDRVRLEVCQNKFLAINQSTERSGFYRALDQMRRRTNQLLSRPTEEQLKKKQTEIQGNWYTELEDGIPKELLREWNFRNIRDKLRFYGLVEHGRQLYSDHKFIKVLEKLQKWEICSPDIAAAVEFCRVKIVGMSEEKFEKWFQLQFPDIQRPVTAPPMRNDDKDTKSIKDGESERSVTRQSSRSSRVQWANGRRPISIR